jgi:hypothetical protein
LRCYVVIDFETSGRRVKFLSPSCFRPQLSAAKRIDPVIMESG